MRGRARGSYWFVGGFRRIAMGAAVVVSLASSGAHGQEFLTLGQFKSRFGNQFGPVNDSIAGYFSVLQRFTTAGVVNQELGLPVGPGEFSFPILPFQGFQDFVDEAKATVDGVPVPSGSTSVAYLWDSKLETFVRSTRPLAPAISQNARTNGLHVLTVGASYSYVNYKKFNDNPTGRNAFSASDIPVFDPETGEPVGQVRDVLFYDTNLKEHVYSFSMQFGVFENLDVGVFVPIVDLRFRAEGIDRFFLEDPTTKTLSPVDVTLDDQGQCCQFPQAEGVSSFDRLQDVNRSGYTDTVGVRIKKDKVGVGDLVVRTKYYFGSVGPAELGGLLGITVPTGDEDNLLGTGSVRLEPRLLLTVAGDRLSTHVNAGYHADVDEHDRDRVDYAIGGELKVFERVTLLVDQVSRLEISGATKTRKFEIIPGLKVNPFRDVVIGFNAIVPLNREGLTTDWTPNAVVDASFVF